MTELDAARWIQNQPGLVVTIGRNREVTLTNGVTVEAKGEGFLGAVIALQHIIRNLGKPLQMSDYLTD